MDALINEEDIRQKLAAEIAGIKMVFPWMNAAGANCRSLEEIAELARSNTGAVVIGTITNGARPGNPGDTYWSGPICSINSRSLPNRGFEYHLKSLALIVETCHQVAKPVIFSIAGTPVDLRLMIDIATSRQVDIIEINLSCPNIKNEPSNAFTPRDIKLNKNDFHCIFDYLFSQSIDKNVKLSVKISPFCLSDKIMVDVTEKVIIDEEKLSQICLAINEYPNIVAVVSCNTLADMAIWDGQRTRFGAMGGPALKPISLAQIKKLKNLLRPDIDIIGVGGISTGHHIAEYLKAGAKAVQVCTKLLDDGVRVFDDFLNEYVDELINMGGNDNDRN